MSSWHDLPPWTDPFPGDAQVVVVAATGGAKSTMVASLTLGVRSLVALDSKASLTLPQARIVTLPPHLAGDDENPAFRTALAGALRWRTDRGETNRVVLRVSPVDIDDPDTHDAIFRAIYERGETLVWIDEVTGTGATATFTMPWLRALSARGRTRGIGLWSLSQSPYGLLPLILRRNAEFTIYGPMDPDDTKTINRPGIEIATTIPRRSGRFILYLAGERDPYRLYVPIPPILENWRAP